MEEDLILGDEDYEEKPKDLMIIDSQLMVINNVLDVDSGLYDDCEPDKIKCISNAMKIIQKLQRKILKEIP